MSRAPAALVFGAAFLATIAGSARAQPPTTTTVLEVRALERELPKEMIQFVARNAAPMAAFTKSERPDLEALTLAQAAESICGSVQPGYLEEFRTLNRTPALGDGSVLRQDAYSFSWPACLYVGINTDQAFAYVPLASEGLGDIREKFTGAKWIDDAAKDLVGLSRNTPVDDFRPFESVPISYWTQPTFVKVGDPVRFKAKLASYGENLSRAAVASPTIAGRVFDKPLIDTQDAAVSCDSTSRHDYPFDPGLVAAAYSNSRQHRSANIGPVSVVVADNGFFGVDCDPTNPSGCPAYDHEKLKFLPRFPAMYFEAGSKGQVGPTIARYGPVNYNQGLQVSPISGHGTHVAGLVVGGPLLENTKDARKDIFSYDVKAWIQLTIANIGGGQETFGADAMDSLFSYLLNATGFKIVNMSVSFDESGTDLSSRISDFMTNTGMATLFVVAAGNRSSPGDVNAGSFPARIGGDNGARLTVLTVASSDADRRISGFSRYSSDAVDIAAPGCKIGSWLEARPTTAAVTMSGTSQATPLVSWTAAMVRSLVKLSPARIKARIVYSGDLLQDPRERAKIHHGVELNIPKALFLFDDLVRYRDQAGVAHTVLGTIKTVAGLSCAGKPDMEWNEFRSFKRATDQNFLYRVEPDTGRVVNCPGGIRPTVGQGTPNQVMIDVSYEIFQEQGLSVVRPVQTRVPPIDIGRIDEIVMAVE